MTLWEFLNLPADVAGSHVLSILFPPKTFEPVKLGPAEIEDGIVWRAYDVRLSGTEKHCMGLDS